MLSHYVGIPRFQEGSILEIILRASRNGFLWSAKFPAKMIILRMKDKNFIHNNFFFSIAHSLKLEITILTVCTLMINMLCTHV